MLPRRRATIIGLCVLGALLIIGGSWWLVARPHDQASADVTQVISAVAKHVALPQDETPAILTVTDTTKIKTQFLQQAHNGDRVLVYQNHKKAIIYRPSIDRVIDMGPVVIDTPQHVE